MRRSLRVVGIAAALGCLVLAGAIGPLVGSEGGAIPEPVSPLAGLGEALVEARCPTFSWVGVEGARGYELMALAVPEGGPEDSAEPQIVIRAQLSAGAQSWTPSLGSCLERGGRYAWSVRVLRGSGEAPWSEPVLFRVAAGPSVEEVGAAIETLKRFIADERDGGEPRAAVAAALEGADSVVGERLRKRLAEARERRAPGSGPAGTPSQLHAAPRRAPFVAAGTHAPPELTTLSAPVLGSPSLSVSANIALGAASNLFKDGAVFLWDDTDGNTALGRDALASATGNATNNTAIGQEALANTTEGESEFLGSSNTAVGHRALYSHTTGWGNTAVGHEALTSGMSISNNTAVGHYALRVNSGHSNTGIGRFALLNNTSGQRNTALGGIALSSTTSGELNTASGYAALWFNSSGGQNTATGASALSYNTTGSRNVALGYSAGINLGYGTVEPGLDDNIFIANEGEPEDKQTIRIGNQDPESVLGTHTKTFIAGIHGASLAGIDEHSVCVDDAGQLGLCTPSSIRFKQDVEDVKDLTARLLELRPVTFRFRPGILGGPGQARFGLIAEEVAELFPELVSRDGEGRPIGVRYEHLSVLLLNELQRQEGRSDLQERELRALHARVTLLERGNPPRIETKDPWWWRYGRGRDSP